jgi:hypothetical protein
MLRHLGFKLPAAFAAGLTALLLSIYPLSLGGGLGESFAVVPALGALAIFLDGIGPRSRWLASGVLVGFALLISVQAASVAIALLVMAQGGSWRAAAERTLLLAGGGFVVAAAAGALMVFAGIWWAAADAVLVYNGAYRQLDAISEFPFIPFFVIIALPLLLPTLGGLLSLGGASANKRVAFACVLWLAAFVLALFMQRRLYGHYLLIAVPPLGILAAFGMERMTRGTSRDRSGLALLVMHVVVTSCVALAISNLIGHRQQVDIATANEQAQAVAHRAAQLTHTGDSIFVWGNAPRVYELAMREPATRYIYLFPLITQGYTTAADIDAVRVQLSEHAPELIVDAGSRVVGGPGLPPLLIKRPSGSDGRDLDLLDPLRDFVRANYVPAGVIDGWPIYRFAPFEARVAITP